MSTRRLGIHLHGYRSGGYLRGARRRGVFIACHALSSIGHAAKPIVNCEKLGKNAGRAAVHLRRRAALTLARRNAAALSACILLAILSPLARRLGYSPVDRRLFLWLCLCGLHRSKVQRIDHARAVTSSAFRLRLFSRPIRQVDLYRSPLSFGRAVLRRMVAGRKLNLARERCPRAPRLRS